MALPSAAVSLPEDLAAVLRSRGRGAAGGGPAVAGRIEDGRLLLDLRAVLPPDDETLTRAVLAARPCRPRRTAVRLRRPACRLHRQRAAREAVRAVTAMQVIATAGHVDHGKSTLVRALTGMEPDRWAEERRRGLTIDLGFAWMDLPGGQRLAFVDVPGHERFVPNMLAGLGPVPAVHDRGGGGRRLDAPVGRAPGGHRRARHLPWAARRHPGRPGRSRSRRGAAPPPRSPPPAWVRWRRSRSARSPAPGCRNCAARSPGWPRGLPVPDPGAPVRLWVDRAFSIKGSGTVVTGTLPAGTVRAGDELLLTPSLRPVRVRAIESMGQPAAQVRGVARVALNLRGVAREVPARGMALVQPGRWTLASAVDVRTGGAGGPGRPACRAS